MQVPVVSSQESWRRKKARTLRRLREMVEQALHFFSLWGRTLQKIGGKYVHFEKEIKKKLLSVDFATFDDVVIVFFSCLVIGWFLHPTGNFGGGVQSFFLFLRFLVLLNFVTSLLIAAFVLVPSIIYSSSSSSPPAPAPASALVNSSLNASGNGFDGQTLLFQRFIGLLPLCGRFSARRA